LRSHSFTTLLTKEWHELLASRAYWILLFVIGPLVGQSFISAVSLYAEVSGAGGGPAALSSGLTSLDGILVPTFGAYDLAVTLLFPFVAIRLVSQEKETGALKLVLQFPASLGTTLAAKGIVLLLGWFVAWLPGLVAIALWQFYGGHLYGPEVLNLLFGHLLRLLLSSGVAVAAAALTESAASAAIVTLGFTLGTWALEFVASGQGGLLQQIAAYTPTAALRYFEQGLLRLSTVIVMLAITVSGFAVAAVWLHTGRSVPARLLRMCVLAIIAGSVVSIGAWLRPSWDFSENRRNSFPAADEVQLAQFPEPLDVTVYLAGEDPRLVDLERNILSKLSRTVPRMRVAYAVGSRTGLFERADDHYGEVWYALGERKVMTHSATEPIVLELLYQLANLTPPARREEKSFPGYPLAAYPTGAALIYYFLWPISLALFWWLRRRPETIFFGRKL
jgi:ABC-type transport system involved in multi-copper enzyme maturation permease subunit